eukprot:Rmarinus@m.6431
MRQLSFRKCSRLLRRRSSLQNVNKPTVVEVEKDDTSSIMTTSSFGRITVLERYSPADFAAQETMFEFALFLAIRPQDLLHCSHMPASSHRKPETPKGKPDQKSKYGESVMALIEWFNLFSNWMASQILSGETPKQRAVLIRGFIEVGKAAVRLRNFSLAMEVVSALNNAAVRRLKQTWELVRSKKSHYQTFQELEAVVARENNFATLRMTMKESEGPALPYLGVFLTDLTFVQDGNSTYLQYEGLINWEKAIMLADIIAQVEDFQRTPYEIKRSPEAEKFFKQLSVPLTDEEMYERSLKVEPRQTS